MVDAEKMIEKEINKIVKSLERYEKVVAIIIFGSYVRDEMKPISDIDIAVILKDEHMEHEIASYSSNIFDVIPFHRLPLYIKFEVLRNGKVVFLRDTEHFDEIKYNVMKEYIEMKPLYDRMVKRILA